MSGQQHQRAVRQSVSQPPIPNPTSPPTPPSPPSPPPASIAFPNAKLHLAAQWSAQFSPTAAAQVGDGARSQCQTR